MENKKLEEHIGKIEGIVKIKNGDKEITAHNKVVNTLFQSLSNFIGSNYTTIYGMSVIGHQIHLGTDTSTPTTPDMTSLVNDLNIDESSFTREVNHNGYVHEIVLTYTWNAGTISDGTTIGEIGFFGRVLTVDNSNTHTDEMIARLSAADNDFTAFQVNASAPLVIQYTLKLTCPS